MRLHHARRSASAVLAAVAVLCVLASCGTSSAPTQTSSPEALTEVQPAEDGLMALTTAIAAVQTNLDKAAASASPALQPSVQQVKTAFAELQTAASGLTADNLRQKAPAIAAALKQVATAAEALSSTLTQSCPGS